MKPKHIYLVRHGESEGNIDKSVYARKPDYALRLTDKGIKDAQKAGEVLTGLLGHSSAAKLAVYLSPHFRTKETMRGAMSQLEGQPWRTFEDPRLREQEWGHLRSEQESDAICSERDSYGTFYYRIPGGESGADVYDRMGALIDTMHRDFERPDFPESAVIFGHGMGNRLFLMRWFHWTVEQFERAANPANGEIFWMSLNEDGRYKIMIGPKDNGGPAHRWTFE